MNDLNILLEIENIKNNPYQSNKRIKNLSIFLKNRIRQKDRKNKGTFCLYCYSKNNLEIHHLVYNQNKMYLTLCRNCHLKHHNKNTSPYATRHLLLEV